MNAVLPALEEAAAQHLVQREPYPIVAAPNSQVIARTIDAARKTDQKIMIIGTGSSFGDQFSLLRDDIIAITTSGFLGVKVHSEYSAFAAAGTPVAEIINSANGYSGRTLGGLLARQANGIDRDIQRSVWQRVSLIEIIDGNGKQRVLAGPAKSNTRSSVGADFLLGSRGKLCVITGVQFAQSFPFNLSLSDDGSTMLKLSSAGRSPITHEDLSATLDPFSVFKW